MKLLVLSIFLSVLAIPTSGVESAPLDCETQSVAALPDYNSWRIRKMRSFFEIKTTPKLFMVKIA